MDEDILQSKVREVMAGIFTIDPSEISTDTSIETLEKWDSLQHVNLMMAIEQKFGVKVNPEDAISMTSFTTLCKTLSSLLDD